MTINKDELCVDNHVGALGIKLCSQQQSTRVTTDKINFVETIIGSRTAGKLVTIVTVSVLLIVMGASSDTADWAIPVGAVVLVVGLLVRATRPHPCASQPHLVARSSGGF